MHVVRDKKSSEVIFIDYGYSESMIPWEEVYSDFDVNSMEYGWTSKSYIPPYFDINDSGVIEEVNEPDAILRNLAELPKEQKIVNGKVVDKTDSELVEEGILDFSELKLQLIESISSISFKKRQEIIPDYKLNNAALGLYDEKRLQEYQATINAFRDEVKRLTNLVDKAKTAADLEKIKENFPDSIIKV